MVRSYAKQKGEGWFYKQHVNKNLYSEKGIITQARFEYVSGNHQIRPFNLSLNISFEDFPRITSWKLYTLKDIEEIMNIFNATQQQDLEGKFVEIFMDESGMNTCGIKAKPD